MHESDSLATPCLSLLHIYDTGGPQITQWNQRSWNAKDLRIKTLTNAADLCSRHVSLIDRPRIPPPLQRAISSRRTSGSKVCGYRHTELCVVSRKCVGVRRIVCPWDQRFTDDTVGLQVDDSLWRKVAFSIGLYKLYNDLRNIRHACVHSYDVDLEGDSLVRIKSN